MILAIDATGLLVRCSRPGARSRLSSGGVATGTLVMFISSLGRKLRAVRPAYLVMAWDGPESRRRRQRLWPPYKAGRPDMAPGRSQNLAMEFCQAAGMLQLMVTGFEADDILAAVQRSASDQLQEARLLVCSDDKDLLQLAGEQTSVTGLTTDSELTGEDVQRAWGVPPHLLPCLRALAGDPSDGIPGLPGIGPRRAARILAASSWTWPLPEAVLPSRVLLGQDQRDLVRYWQKVMDLQWPQAIPEDTAGEGYFFLPGRAEWDPVTLPPALLGMLGKYELSALSDRLRNGRLW